MRRASIALVAALVVAAIEGIAMARWAMPERGKQEGVEWLNNLVAELLDVKEPQSKLCAEWTFTNPREGWVFISSTAEVKGADGVWVALDEASKGQALVVHSQGQGATLEAMRYLAAGTHKVRAWQEGKPSLQRLVVRAIPELIFCKFQYDPHIVPHGPYDWAFLKRHVLPHLNCIVGSGAREHQPFLEEWKRQGKKRLLEVYASPYFERKSAEDAYRHWAESARLTAPLLDGIIVDEFGGGEDERYRAITESVRRLRRDERFKGRVFYPYCGSMYGARLSEEFIRTVVGAGYRFAWERSLQLPDQPTDFSDLPG